MKKEKHILFCALDKFPPFRVDVATLFAEKLVNRGYKIDWVLQSKDDCDSHFITEWGGGQAYVGPTVNSTSFLQRLKKNLYNILHDFIVFKLPLKNNYDFIIVRDKFFSALLSIISSRYYKIKFIFWLSYPFPESDLYEIKDKTARYPFIYYIRGHIRKFLLYRIIFPLADHIFVQTYYMKDTIVRNYNLPSAKMTPVPMGVNLDQIPYFGYDDISGKIIERKKIVYLGTLIKTRKLDFLIRVFFKVKKNYPESELILVGGGEDKTDDDLLTAQIEKLNLKNSVKITGMLPQREAWLHINNASVCVSPICPSPILNCGSPTKLIEYMAMGKAVVANDHPEQKDIIRKSCAGICVPWEEDAFADAIIKLLSDPERCRYHGMQGYKFVAVHRSYEILADIVDNRLSLIAQNN